MRRVSVPKKLQKRYPYHRPAFLKKVVGARPKRIRAAYDSRRDWCKDPKGYFIIKVFYARKLLGARYCTYDHVPRYDVLGKDAESIVQTIVRNGLATSLQHAAYLGHELHKAETALKLRLNFVQDSPLDHSKRTKKRESDNLPE
jgi:hypothetical protein